MTPESQQRILDATTRLFAEVSNALGTKTAGYEEGIRFIREYGNKTVLELVLVGCSRIAPITIGADVSSLTPETAQVLLGMMDTRQKAEALLATLPEPDPVFLGKVLKEVSSMLPSVRTVLYPFAKRLPPPPGGRPKKLADPEARQRIRDEIGQLYVQGVDLRDAQARLAQREGVSPSTIQRIWAERKKQTKEQKD